MAYCEERADRIRKALQGVEGIAEKKMFGGLSFMLHGNMCCGIADRDLGLGRFFERSLTSLATPGSSLVLLIIAFVVFTVIITNLASNNAVVSTSAALVLAVAPATGINPVALVVVVAVASSMAFSLPISTPPNAIVFASGQVRSGTMAKGGSVLSLLCVLILLLLGFTLANRMFPWPG